jgi:phosphoribosylglycinamide formyltransferase-1
LRQSRIDLKKIAIFSSSEGSNAANLILYFKNHPTVSVVLLVSDRGSSKALQKAEGFGIKTRSFEFFEDGFPENLPNELKNEGIELVALSGYFTLLPPAMIKAFPDKIINIHPSLLPAFGGKGYYGLKPVEMALKSKNISTGVSIHYVDEFYDHGDVIFRSECSISQDDTLESLAERIKMMEFYFYPRIIENILQTDARIQPLKEVLI